VFIVSVIVQSSLTVTSCSFYRASYALRGICHGRVSVCLSVRPSVSVISRCSTKMAKHRNTQTTPHDSPETLVF